jgi:PEP-CTERM motif
MRKFSIACALVMAASTTVSADLVSSSLFRSIGARTPAAPRSANGDSFTAATVAFSDLGGAFLDDGSGAPVFGGTSAIGLNVVSGAAVNIDTLEVAGPGAGQSTLTFRIYTDDGLGGTPAFAPAGTTLGGDPVGALQFEIGDFNAGLDLVEWTPLTPFTIDSAGVEYFANASSIIDFPLAIDPLAPGSSGVFSNAGAGLSILAAISIGDGAGGLGDITAFGIDEVIISVVITEVPEPATLSLLGFGAVALLRRRRA